MKYPFGSGLEGGSVEELGKFTIQANNRLGEPMKDGGDQFEVKVHGPYSSDVPAHVVDNKDGTYSVAYTPIDFGDHVVNISLKGTPIVDSPKTVSIDKSLDGMCQSERSLPAQLLTLPKLLRMDRGWRTV
jgi:hypothetical protein